MISDLQFDKILTFKNYDGNQVKIASMYEIGKIINIEFHCAIDGTFFVQ